MADLPGLANDGLSIVLSSIRRGIQGRTQNQNIFGIPIPTPSYDELRKKELSIIKGLSSVPTALEASGDWKKNGPINSKVENIDDPNIPTTINTTNKFTDRGLYIYDLETNEKIKIQFVPQELDYKPESNFVAIASMARNNPLYHYVGSEDTLEFTLDWFAREESREDVIRNCKKLEALTKNDSFGRDPHPVKLIWNSKLFSDAQWLVVAAPYKLSLFQAHRSMLPQQAIQTITLKRITEGNTSIQTIRNINF